MGTESISFSGREFHACASTMEIWLRLLTVNIHYPCPKLRELQIEWLDASHDLECFTINLNGHEEHFPKLLEATDRVLKRLHDCGDSLDGRFVNLLGFTSFSAPNDDCIDTKHIVKAGKAFRGLLTGDNSTSMPINRDRHNSYNPNLEIEGALGPPSAASGH